MNLEAALEVPLRSVLKAQIGGKSGEQEGTETETDGCQNKRPGRKQ